MHLRAGIVWTVLWAFSDQSDALLEFFESVPQEVVDYTPSHIEPMMV